jgi:hypothetical protein
MVTGAFAGRATTFSFGNRSSQINISDGATLNVVPDGVTIGGTIGQESGGSITGQAIDFNNGVFESDGLSVFLKSTYSPTDGLLLTGNKFAKFEPGTFVPNVTVSSTGNKIEGQPVFTGTISLYNSSAALSLAIQNALSKSISLNGGTLTLEDDLSLADNVKILGTGTVNLNNRQLTLGGYYSSAWSQNLTFEQATSIYLTGNVSLGATWTFSGVNRINGNGATLDLSSGGCIALAAGATLYLEDIVIKGFGNSNSYDAFAFGDTNATIYLSNVDLSFSSDAIFSSGKIVVNGYTTFILRGYNITFAGTSKLTVNGVTLWLDVLDKKQHMDFGKLYAPNAVYDNYGYNTENVTANINSGNLELLNGGSILEVSSDIDAVSPLENSLFNMSASGELLLLRSFTLRPNQSINIVNDVTIDGQGATITFTDIADISLAQLIIAAGKKLTLKNITLTNIGQNTFDLGAGSSIEIGENVIFEISQDIYWDNATFTLLGDGLTVFNIRGLEKPWRLQFASNAIERTRATLAIGSNELRLENIELVDLANVSFTQATTDNPDVTEGIVALAGDATVDIGASTGMNFAVEGQGNTMALLADKIAYTGTLFFGEKPLNELHVKFALTTTLEAGRVASDGTAVTDGNPMFVLGRKAAAGETIPESEVNFYIGGSEMGKACLYFDDPSVSLDMVSTVAFKIGKNSLLKFNNLELLSNDVQLLSADVVTYGTAVSGKKFDPSFIRIAKQKKKAAQKQAAIKPAAKKKKQAKRGIDLTEIEESQALETPDVIIRAIRPPETFSQTYVNTQLKLDSTTALTGNLRFERVTVENFMTYLTGSDGKPNYVPFNILAAGYTKFIQGDSNIKFNPSGGQTLNISGKGNEIEVRKTVTIKDQLLFDTGAELTFNFVNDGSVEPTVIFDENSSLSLDSNCILRFSGHGRVIFYDGSTITFGGTRTEDSRTGSVTFSDKPTMILQNGAVLDWAPKATVTVTGVGTIELLSYGLIAPSSIGALIIGNSASDDIDLKVVGTSEIRLEVPTLDSATQAYISGLPLDDQPIKGKARLSFYQTGCTLTYENGGMLTIGNNGLCEINTYGQVREGFRGDLKEYSHSHHGLLYVKTGGKLTLASNVADPKTQAEKKFDWYGSQSTISGSGLVEYVYKPETETGGKYRGFTAKLSATCADLYKDTTSITMEQLATWLVQTSSTLKLSTLYVDESGNNVVRTKNGVSVTLNSGDTIVSENTDGSLVGRTSSGASFTISVNGERR